MEKVQNYCIVYCNTDTLANAELISKAIISEKLAACVSIIPNIISIYEWEDKIEQRNEFNLTIKTSLEKMEKLEIRITELHSDKVPEIICVGINSISKPYLEWMKINLQ